MKRLQLKNQLTGEIITSQEVNDKPTISIATVFDDIKIKHIFFGRYDIAVYVEFPSNKTVEFVPNEVWFIVLKDKVVKEEVTEEN
jgi:hypothetical protein